MAWSANWCGNYPYNKKKSKYGANKVEIKTSDGGALKFDSKKEAKRYIELRYMEQAGEISDLQLQVKYVLIPAQREPDKVGARGGVIKGKVIERECAYIADFTYFDKHGIFHVEDAKGMKTEVYKIKKKLMLYIHKIKIEEV